MAMTAPSAVEIPTLSFNQPDCFADFHLAKLPARPDLVIDSGQCLERLQVYALRIFVSPAATQAAFGSGLEPPGPTALSFS